MQHKQLNFKLWLFAALLVSMGGFGQQSAYSAGTVTSQARDPILDGGPAGPCNPQRDSADYVGGTDANGHPVPPADLAAVPGQMLIPLKTGRGRDPIYVQADGKKLESLLNPSAACPAKAGQ